MPKTIYELAQAKREADKIYEKAMNAHLLTCEPMELKFFWDDPLAVLRREIIAQLNAIAAPPVKWTRDKVITSAIKQGFGSILQSDDDYDDYWVGTKMGRWEQIAQFAARYSQVKRGLYKKMDQMPGLDCGDRSRRDLLSNVFFERGFSSLTHLVDSLPLSGRDTVRWIMEDDIVNRSQLEKVLDNPVGKTTSDPLKDFILNGENYVEMTIGQELAKSYLSVSRSWRD
jgi:hypothetical protein